MAVVTLLLAACARPSPPGPATVGQDGVRAWAVVLQEALLDPPGSARKLFILDRLCSDAGRTNWAFHCSIPFAGSDRHALAESLDVPVEYVRSEEGLAGPDGFIRDGGRFVLLGRPRIAGRHADVGINETRETSDVSSEGFTYRLRRAGDTWEIVGGSGVGGSASS